MAAVARYSGSYWGNYILIYNSGGGSSSIQPNLFGIRLHWKGFWKADAAGAIAGAVTSIITGDDFIRNTLGGGLGASIAHLFISEQ